MKSTHVIVFHSLIAFVGICQKDFLNLYDVALILARYFVSSSLYYYAINQVISYWLGYVSFVSCS